MKSRKMLATVVLVTTLFTSSVASGPSGYPGSQSYGGYNQQQHQQLQQQQYQPQQQKQDQWYTDASQASFQKDNISTQEQTQVATSTAEPTTVAEDVDVEPAPLPEGWSEHFDPNSDQYYYYNAASGTTSWDRPLSPDTTEQEVAEGESKGEDSKPSEQGPGTASTGATDVVQNPTPEREHQGTPQDLVPGGINVMTETGEISDSSPKVESWQSQSNHSPQMKQPGPNEPSGTQHQQGSWGGQRQSDQPQANEWTSSHPIQQNSDGNKWGQSNATESSIVGGEQEAQKYEYQGQPPQIQQQPPQQQELQQSSGWGLPQQTNAEDRQPKPEQPWGLPRSPEQQPQHPADPRKQQQPPPLPSRETQASPRETSSDQTLSDGRWGIPKATVTPSPNDRPQNTDSPYPQRQSWQEQRPTQGTQQPPDVQQRPPVQQGTQQPPDVQQRPSVQSGTQQPSDVQQRPPAQAGTQQPPDVQQRPPVQQGPPHPNRPPPQQQQPSKPQYMQRQYPPQTYGQYNSNAPPGQGQYDPKYGGPNSYGRGYPPQQQPQSQPTGTGQLISQGTEAGTTAVKEALSTTWKGLLGFGNRTRDVVGTAREQVVTGATAAGQTLSARSTSMWETAKSTVGGVFENNDSGSQSDYSLSGHPRQFPPDSRPPPNYPGRPTGPNPGYPNGPGSPGGRGPPPRNVGGPQQQPGRYGPPFGQQPPRYGGPPNGGPPGRQQPPPSQQQSETRPQGYPDMQPRRDPPYPQTHKGPHRGGPMQSQYGNQPGSQPPAQGGGYPNQQRPPFSGPPGAQSNRGPDMEQGPPQQKQQQPDPWDHPGLMGDHY